MSDSSHTPLTSSDPIAVSAPPSDQGGLAVKAGAIITATGEVITEAVRYGIVITQLTAAGVQLALLSDQVTSTYEYIEKCAASADDLADQAEALNVDRDTIGEHRDAATVMRSVLADAQTMANRLAELSTSFRATADAHETDYGPVAEAANAMPVEMADRTFYSNR